MLFEDPSDLDFLDENDLEQQYEDWLFENCKCDLAEDGCDCLNFDTWFSCKDEPFVFDDLEAL